MPLIPRILPKTQGAIIDIPHTAKRLIQVYNLIGRRIKAVTIGAVRHSQIIHSVVNLVKQQVSQKTAVLADGTLYLPGLNAGVSRGGTDESARAAN